MTVNKEQNGVAHLLGPSKSALLPSSATMDKKSWMSSGGALLPENVMTDPMIQSGQRVGRPGTSLSAKQVSWQMKVSSSGMP